MIWIFIGFVIMASLVIGLISCGWKEEQPKPKPKPEDDGLQEIRLSGCISADALELIERVNGYEVIEFDHKNYEYVLKRRHLDRMD